MGDMLGAHSGATSPSVLSDSYGLDYILMFEPSYVSSV